MPPRNVQPAVTRPKLFAAALTLLLAGAVVCPATLAAQRHSFGSSPPTAPPPPVVHPPAAPSPATAAVQNLGPLQLVSVSYGVLPPQALLRQLQSEDDRTRSAALSAIGVPGQYLMRGHVAFAHSLRLELAPLGSSDELDALLTIELDQHLVTAILKPDDAGWHRIGTILYASTFGESTANPGTFVQTARSFIQPGHYRAVFRAGVRSNNGDYFETEANLRVLGDHAVVVISYISEARTCSDAQGHTAHVACELTRRWLETDTTEGAHRITLVTGSGRLPVRDNSEASPRSRLFMATHLRTFTCQPYQFSEPTQRFEMAGTATACAAFSGTAAVH